MTLVLHICNNRKREEEENRGIRNFLNRKQFSCVWGWVGGNVMLIWHAIDMVVGIRGLYFNNAFLPDLDGNQSQQTFRLAKVSFEVCDTTSLDTPRGDTHQSSRPDQ